MLRKEILSPSHGLFIDAKLRDKVRKIGEDNGFILYHNIPKKKIYLTKSSSQDILASANFVETKEAEIALLSNISSVSKEDKQCLFNLLKNHISEKRADLFYYEEKSDLAITHGLEKFQYEPYVMVLHKKKETQVIPLQDLILVNTKLDLLKNLTPIKEFLLKHSNWARKAGAGGLTEERLALRITESTHTFVLTNLEKDCLGYVSYIANGTIGYGYNFAVHAEYRAKGLGKLLVLKLSEQIPENNTLFLISAYEGPTIKQVKALYEKIGFQTLEKNPELRKCVLVGEIPHKKTLKCKL